jgi:hypothetical protein
MSVPGFVRTRRFVFVVALLLGSLAYTAPRLFGKRPHAVVPLFPGLEGPSSRTVVAKPIPADWRSYHHAGSSRLAILLTDTASDWLGLARGLSTIGIPFTITQDWREAISHRVVWVYPRISGAFFSADALRGLGAIPRNGGTLLANEVVGGGLEEMFGFSSVEPSRVRRTLRMTSAGIARFSLTDSAEQVLRLSRPTTDSLRNSAIGSYSYRPTTAESLALFDDGQTAISHRLIGTGHAYILGIDVGQLFLIGYNNREEGLARSYVNQYEPSVDVMLRIVRDIYERGEPDAVILWTVPDGKSLSVIFSHDIDYAKAWKNSISFARMELSKGIRATYFVQTKYVRDWNDEIFFDSSGVSYARRLDSLGMEIGSHSVAHSRQFGKLELGTGEEEYPSYQPFVMDRQNTEHATVLGELRVSKFLLESMLGGKKIESFRPGHLVNPYSLPQALEATGFKYSSSVTANNSLTHLPFRLTYNREGDAESSIYEFPVTIEDEEQPSMDKRFINGLSLARKIARYGGLFVLLTHPNVTAEKFAYERDLADSLKDEAWFGSVDKFGEWWAARDQIKVDVAATDSISATVILDPKQPTKLVAIEVPDGWKMVEDISLGARQNGRFVVLPTLPGRAQLRFTHPQPPTSP